MSTNTYSAALDIINDRRLAAKAASESRMLEVRNAIPEIEEISNMLAQSSINILRIISKGENVKEEMAKLESKNLEAQQMIRSLLVSHGYPEDYLELKYTCSRCADTGFYEGKRCSCLEELAGKLAAKELNEVSPLVLSTFDTFSLEYYRGVSTDQDPDCFTTMSNNLRYCKNYAANFTRNSNNIFISGGTGLGKTHLSLAIAERLISMNWNVVYGSTVNLMDKIESEHFGRSEGETLSIMLDADLLILDDLGSEYEKPFCVATIYNIINTRLNKRIPTIISTNFSPKKIESRYEPRIVSRIFSSYDYLRFTGNDVRQMIKAEAIRKNRFQ